MNLGFGLWDYIYFIPIGFIIFQFANSNFYYVRAFSVLIISYILVSSPVLYYFHMSDGNYKAKKIEEYDMKIGEGTNGSQVFEVQKIKDEFIVKLNSYDNRRFVSKEEMSLSNNLYLKKYYEDFGDDYLTLTAFGYVKIHDKSGKVITEIKVFY